MAATAREEAVLYNVNAHEVALAARADAALSVV